MTVSNELLVRVGEAAIRESNARQALADTEARAGGTIPARQARTELSNASRALQALIAEAR